MSKNDNYRYVAYDAANGEYEEFETLKEAEDWLQKMKNLTLNIPPS